MLGAVAFPDARAHLFEPARYRRVLQVTPCDAEVLAQRQQYFGYAAHAYAADADEMYVPYSSKKHLFYFKSEISDLKYYFTDH
jgi:hypothetical protein